MGAPYSVVWKINILDANSPRDAAESALAIQRDKGSDTTLFTVHASNGRRSTIDLGRRPKPARLSVGKGGAQRR